MEILVTRIKSDPGLPPKCLPTQREVVAAFTYAALHDAFQGPFGHTLDSLREQLVGSLDRDLRLDKAFFNYMCGLARDAIEGRLPSAPLSVKALVQTLEETIARPHGIDLAWLLGWLQHASLRIDQLETPRDKKRRQEIGWVYELLEGPIDADRWDYLWRDTLHLGFIADHRNIQDLLQDFKDDVHVHWNGTSSRLVVSQELADLLGSIFFPLRKRLYKSVYENPEKRIVDGILVRCVHLSLLTSQPNIEEPLYREFLTNFVHITDSELLSILERSPDSPLGSVINRLVRELRTYPAVRIPWKKSLRTGPSTGDYVAPEVVEKFKYTGQSPPILTASKTPFDILAAIESNLHADGSVDRIKKHYSTQSLALHCMILPIRPLRLLQLERILWKVICRKLEQTSIIQKIIRAILDTMPQSSTEMATMQEIQRAIDLCPPVFISFPWIPRFSVSALQEMTRDAAISSLLVRQSDGTLVERTPADLMTESGNEESWVAVGGYLLYATRHLTVTERDQFEAAMTSGMEHLLEKGCCLALPQELIEPKGDLQVLEFLLGPAESPYPA